MPASSFLSCMCLSRSVGYWCPVVTQFLVLASSTACASAGLPLLLFGGKSVAVENAVAVEVAVGVQVSIIV